MDRANSTINDRCIQDDTLVESPVLSRPSWQQWAGSDNPHDAIEKLRARAQRRTRSATSQSSTEMLREMREKRHRTG